MNRLLLLRRYTSSKSWITSAMKHGEDLGTHVLEGKKYAVDLYVDNQLQLINNIESRMLEKMRPGEEIEISISSNIGIFNNEMSKKVKKADK